jgi:DHA2 family multidrug resistance protein
MLHAVRAKGQSATEALQSGSKALEHSVMKQASVLSYMVAFLYPGVMFLICIPFVLMVKKSKGSKVGISESMH